MKRLDQIQAVVQDKNAREWFYTMRRAKRRTWQRDEARAGLRGAVNLAVGMGHAVEVSDGRDIEILIDGRPVAATFYFG